MTKHYLSICVIVKNEALYIDEFIAWNQLQGVEHFFIYENESTDNTWESIKKYQDIGIATIQRVFGKKVQSFAYELCLKNYGQDSQWIAFLDADEFLYTTKSNLPTLLKEYESYPALAVNWLFFGSNGHENYQPGLIIERFTKRGQVDRHVKTILQPHLTRGCGNNSHYFRLAKPAVNENKVELSRRYARIDPSAELFRIAHFHTKSKEEYNKRKLLGEPDGVVRGNIEERFKCHNQNEIEDLFLAKQKSSVIVKIINNLDKFLKVFWKC